MPEPDVNVIDSETERIKVDDDTTTVQVEPDDSKAQLIKSNANGGAGGNDHLDDYNTAIIDPTPTSSDGGVSFNGLGKEEVMKYANDPFWVRLRWILFILFWVGWLAMLVTAVAIIVLAPRCPPRPDLKWYHTDTVYQVYAKSFSDSNDDGLGDFKGLVSKLEYITNDVGSKTIWLNAIFKGDGSDYGILDHKELDDFFGVKLDEFKAWLKTLRKQGTKVILDLIPNQTSKNHTWFVKSREGKAPYTDYYIWSDGSTVPNDLKNENEPAWSYDDVRQAVYYHRFSSEHPELNLNNPDVRKEIVDIMKFWMDAGVSGFYIQDVEYLVEDPDITQSNYADKNYNGTFGFLEELREVANSYSDKPGREKLLFATVRNQTLEYWGTGDKKRLHIVAPLMEDLDSACDAACIKTLVDARLFDKKWVGQQLGNQNVHRIASRMDDQTGNYKFHLMIAHALQLLLPGTPLNYYGDEFGQRDGIDIGNAKNSYRSPMQWNTQDNAGFTSKNVTPWQQPGPYYKIDNYQANKAHFGKDKPFTVFTNLTKLRQRESFQWGKTEICTPKKHLLLFTRQAERFPFFLILINTDEKLMHVAPEDLNCVTVKDDGIIRFHSRNFDGSLNFDHGLELQAFDIVVVEFPAVE